jgi:hypothetical protein
VPVRVTDVPPTVAPNPGDTDVTVATATYLNVAGALDTNGVVTTTFTGPAACAGATTVSDVAEDTDRPVPATPPNVTDVTPVNAKPVNVTTVPPADEPDDGDTTEIEGATKA